MRHFAGYAGVRDFSLACWYSLVKIELCIWPRLDFFDQFLQPFRKRLCVAEEINGITLACEGLKIRVERVDAAVKAWLRNRAEVDFGWRIGDFGLGIGD